MTTMSSKMKAFQAFFQKRQTGLVQRSKAWVEARRYTIGASEMAALTGKSPFDTPRSLLRKKLDPPDLSKNVACAWGTLFESFARSYIEWKHNTRVFGHTTSLNLPPEHPLYGKVTCSPAGYFQGLDKSPVLLEIKCPFNRRLAVNKIPSLYRDQVQTGLALSGDLVTKGLYVDCCFRMCSLTQLGMNLSHNATPHYAAVSKTKTPFPQAWGLCILESQQKLTPRQKALFNLGANPVRAKFDQVMRAIASGAVRVRYKRVRVVCDSRTRAEERFNLKNAKSEFIRAPWRGTFYHPVAFFAWKLLDITEIEELKDPNYLKALEQPILRFHQRLNLEVAKQAGTLETTPNTLEDDTAILEAFLQGRN